MAEAEGAVWYHGIRREGLAGPSAVLIEYQLDGRTGVAGVLHHVVKHSPTGMGWGYPGSGAADLARSLLIAAVGDAAKCPVCRGVKVVVWSDDAEEPRPYDRDRDGDNGEKLAKTAWVEKCYACDDGYSRALPYQRFKFAFVARWGEEFRISQAQILAWLAEQPDGDDTP